ncbi:MULTISPECIES: DUF3010 family protein [Shewanella]|jgi:hypothetical protein|uniref:DUF3010 family protein n=1 Tax=Shewanella chilikensis TaxID=558541 RepID=A0A6G7LRC7_9GAMM|nr:MULTISPECIES: DUF3010 family protein [Shewanella]MBZ4680187.1 hypothetical protein [Shewanella sp.]MCA0951359.1 DUF3010 family protein [Shewanella chilikensis]MCE9853361.1 DUF3010 family protein [Shewanella chilikensis]MCL1153847.1 DUF3010 family protein [Shewanella chilikensis]MCL1163694.1 DUF3010 family protein [Shewanella chilikensis]
MKVCAVELKGGEAVICLLSAQGDVFNVPDCRRHSFTLSNPASQEAIREFQFAFNKLMEDYQVEHVVIIEREYKGKLAGTSVSFKFEAAIQLGKLPVTMLTPQSIKEQLKRNPPQVDFSGLELKKFQQNAFDAAYAFQQMRIYKKV